jgi:hypothetical protein
METRRNACNIPVRKQEGKTPAGDLDMDGRIILKWSLNKPGDSEM